MTLAELTGDIFQPHLNDRFEMRSDASVIEVTLVSINRRAAGPGEKRAPFSLVFRGPHAPVWPQRIYRLSHATLGEFDIFFVPIGPDQLGLQYEAVFG